MDFNFSGTSVMSIDGDDELVGIGTVEPLYKLHVVHGSNSPGNADSDEGLNITNSNNDDSWTLYTRTVVEGIYNYTMMALLVLQVLFHQR